jgi:hypothetical protein
VSKTVIPIVCKTPRTVCRDGSCFDRRPQRDGRQPLQARKGGPQICLRLQGFGLAQLVEVAPLEVSNSNYSARPTARGLMLLKLLRENVPTWSRYFNANGPLESMPYLRAKFLDQVGGTLSAEDPVAIGTDG